MKLARMAEEGYDSLTPEQRELLRRGILAIRPLPSPESEPQAKDSSKTREEFELGYARAAGLTLNEWYELGYGSALCRCELDGCKGWQMIKNYRR